MSTRARIGIGVGLAAVIALLAWALADDGAVEPTRRARSVPSSEPIDAGAPAHEPEVEHASQDDTDPWAHEQPPPDYTGEPTDAGLPPRTLARHGDFQPMSDGELMQRRRESVELITTTVHELDGEIERAEASGRDDLVSILRHRRDQLVARRDQLEALLPPE